MVAGEGGRLRKGVFVFVLREVKDFTTHAKKNRLEIFGRGERITVGRFQTTWVDCIQHIGGWNWHQIVAPFYCSKSEGEKPG